MTITVESKGKIILITLNRPEVLNALDPASMRELRRVIAEFNESDNHWVAILTGSGEKAFCVGADIESTVQNTQSPAQLLFSGSDEARDEFYVRALDFTDLKVWKPVIAAINGHAVGGGLELALWCDIRLATSNATFGLPEVRIGSIPAVGGIRRLMLAVPSTHAMHLLLTGKRITADEALRMGLISEMVEPSQLISRAFAIAADIAGCAPLAVRAAKMLSFRSRDLPAEQEIELEQMVWSMLKATADRREGRRAFLEKREPDYRGE